MYFCRVKLDLYLPIHNKGLHQRQQDSNCQDRALLVVVVPIVVDYPLVVVVIVVDEVPEETGVGVEGMPQ